MDFWGFEEGLKQVYTDEGWTGGFSITNTAAAQHQVGGVGGAYAASALWFGDHIGSPLLTAQHRYLQFFAYPTNPAAPGTFEVSFTKSGTENFKVTFTGSSGVVTALRGATTVATGSYSPTVQNWIEIDLVADNAGGVTVKANGVTLLTFSGDTQDSGTAGWDRFAISPTTAVGVYVDDIVVTTSAEGATGEAAVPALLPTGDDAVDLTPSSGTDNYAMVDERPASASDYNEGTVANDEDVYDLSALPAGTEAILGVKVRVWGGRDGAITDFEATAVSGSTTLRSSAATLPASPGNGVVSLVMAVDPDTSVAWTDSGVNALKAGARIS